VESRVFEVGLNLATPVPNPVTSVGAIDYSLPSNGHVSLSIVDIQGRLLRNLVSEVQPAGRHTIRLDTRGIRGNVVFARLDFHGKQLMKRLVLLH